VKGVDGENMLRRTGTDVGDPHGRICPREEADHDTLTRPPARREELLGELGHHGDRDGTTFFWDTEPLCVTLRHTPDPLTFGLALVPVTGYSTTMDPSPHRCGPTTERIPN
jgi:hypothetical protein